MSDRNLVEVIDQMLAALPQNELKLCRTLRGFRQTLRADVTKYRISWLQIEAALRLEFGEPPSAGWQRVVADIFRGDPAVRPS